MDRVIALFDFNATDPGELSFKKGDTLSVLERKYKQWWVCKNENGMCGVVPRNHVKPLVHSGTGSTLIDRISKVTNQSTPIGRRMATAEVVSQLVAHGCRDLTSGLDLSSFAEYPVSHGGFSDVYRGQLSNGPSVAVKALRVSIDNITQDPKHLKHAARELHTWSRCRHPNVIPLLGLAIFRDRIGMVSPWMMYGSLPRYLMETSGVDRLNMCIQICEGLTYLHRIQIIHCDLKGANILVSDEGIPALTDFGNSSLVDRTLNFTQTTSGPSFTVRWSAAEIIEETTPHTKASDIYALGMTIYETVTGMVPYQGKSEMNVMRLVTVKKELPERPEPALDNTGITDKLWELLIKCWSFQPAERPSAAKVAEVMRAIAPDTHATSTSQTATSNNQDRPDTEEHSGTKHAQEKESKWLKKLEKEEEVAKLRAAQAQELAEATWWKRFAHSPIPESEELTVSSDSSVGSKSTGNLGLGASARTHVRRPPEESTQRTPTASSESSRRLPTSTDEPTSTSTLEATRQAWNDNLLSEWERRSRGAREEPPHPDPGSRTHSAQHTPSSSYRYRPASAEAMAAAESMSVEEIKYRRRQASRAAHEAREASAARKAFEQEHKRLGRERREREEEHHKNQVVESWQRYERQWLDLLNGVFPEGRHLTFYDIPWPVSKPARSFEELQLSAIERFLLSPYHSITKTRKMRLRSALMQWHPDKFAERFINRLEESHRTAIIGAVTSVARMISELMNEKTDS
ncbi:unnamed protein product [Rhizoctonia solani]|uniref:mitogen-activated protein kinase kinase kinase n=1 Tax=Rhizoctonia solani TaxID=456999 RepID=A0A8H3DVD1_9AGAM|nr:unnamed protein product [Rhizoctonia solani]